jgi:predicted Zn-dependent peptidase
MFPLFQGTTKKINPSIHFAMQQKKLEQVHLCIGMKGISAGHPDRYAAYVLNSVLGGSVSSRLF